MADVNLSNARDLRDHYDNNIEELRDNLREAGADVEGARTIGAYIGVTGGLTGIVGTETQLAYAYDQETGRSYVFSYTGATFGVGSPLPGAAQFGGFTFTGDPTGLSGFSGGFQGASGASAGIAINRQGQILAQYGVETDLAVEITAGFGTQILPLTPGMLANQNLLSQILDGLTNPQNYLDYLTPTLSYLPPTLCFLEDSTVQMWPLDPSIKPRADGSYDEELVLSKVWYKRQDQMQAGDIVVSPDKWGRLQPGRVTRTMTNIATHILDFWGTGVTPGHAYNCADGLLKGGFAPLMDILRMDGALMRSDGTMFRSTTNCDVGSMGDRLIHAEASTQRPDGSWTPKKHGKIRFGTRVSTPDGKKSVSVMEIAERQGWSVSDDGYMLGKTKDADGSVQEYKFPFPYIYGAELPKPEDYILTRSQVSLEEIYISNEWEQISTRMPAPDSLAGFNPNSAMKRTKSKPNIPPAFANRPDAPIAKNGVQLRANAPTRQFAHGVNRKPIKETDAKNRKLDTIRKKPVDDL